jgi:hypothetical protein
MALVRFRNATNFLVHLHLRVGPVATHPDDRGSRNSTVAVGEQFDENVGDGDVWYCYGRRMIGGDEDPELCNAAGGATVVLDATHPCFVQN